MLDDATDIRQSFNPTARLIFINAVALMAIGLLMIYSASMSVNPDETYTVFQKQLMYVPVALVAMLAAMHLPGRWLSSRYLALGAMAACGGLLVLVILLGSYRWFRFRLGPLDLSVQPSEIAKLALIVFFAWFLSRPRAEPRAFWRGFAPLAGVLGAVCLLIAYQDLGTAALIAAVGVGLMIAGGVRLRHLAVLIAPTGVAGYLLVALYPYRIERLTTFLDPWKDPEGAGYQVIQSLIAIGSGGWWGRGLGSGMQKYFYLPEDTTDFIFSVVCEEMGLAGGTMVIMLFMTLVLLGLRVVGAAERRFDRLLALGVVLWVGLQSLINIGVATAALPTKGIALPLVSYGGTGLVLTSAALGLVLSVARRSPGLAFTPPQAKSEPDAVAPA